MEGGKYMSIFTLRTYVVLRYDDGGNFLDFLSYHPDFQWCFTDNFEEACLFPSLKVAERVVTGNSGGSFLRVMECNGDFLLHSVDSFLPVSRKVKVYRVPRLSYVTCCGSKSFISVNESGNCAISVSNKVRNKFGWDHPLYEDPDIPF